MRRLIVGGLIMFASCSESTGQDPSPGLDAGGVTSGDVAATFDTHTAVVDTTMPPLDAVEGSDQGAMDDAETVAPSEEVFVPPEDSGGADIWESDGAVAFHDADAVADVQGSDVTDDGVSSTATDTGVVDVASPEDTSPAAADSEDLDVGESAPDVAAMDSVTVEDSVLVEDSAPVEDVGPPEPEGPLYLLSVNNSTHTLEKIDVETGAGTDLCQLSTSYSYPSLTFSRDNVLYASRTGNTLDVIDPCTCQITTVGPYNGYTGVNGITSDFGLNLFGVSHIQDELITINTSTGAGTGIGPLGVDFGYTGATWSEAEQTVYAIDASSDALFVISPETGAATLVAPLSQPMGTVGIEMHPANGLLYACSDAAHLLEIDIATGEVTDIGDMGQNTACNNLAAPWKSVPCLD